MFWSFAVWEGSSAKHRKGRIMQHQSDLCVPLPVALRFQGLDLAKSESWWTLKLTSMFHVQMVKPDTASAESPLTVSNDVNTILTQAVGTFAGVCCLCSQT